MKYTKQRKYKPVITKMERWCIIENYKLDCLNRLDKCKTAKDKIDLMEYVENQADELTQRYKYANMKHDFNVAKSFVLSSIRGVM